MSTPVKINNPDAKKLKVLVAPLDWGLGHVTRCIPIIKELLIQKCVVIAAVSGAQKAVLQGEFSDLTFVEIPGYEIKYGKNRALTLFKIILSIPKILIRVNKENAWLRRFTEEEKPDLIISDNRYGMYGRGVFSIFITHQLQIQTPFGPAANRLLQRINYRMIRHFSRCWVPDIKGAGALAGALSNPETLPAIPVRYIGWLSRFGEGTAMNTPVDLLILLSGPEPQRTLLEKKILEQLGDHTGQTVLVRGIPGHSTLDLEAPPQVTIHNHLPAAALEGLLRSASLIITRAGYSTIMDLMRLGKKAILIPTPGQTEQEYLGNYLAEKGWAICIEQKGFSFTDALTFVETTSKGSNLLREQEVNLPDERTGEQLLRTEIREVLSLIAKGQIQSLPPALG